MKNRMSKTVLLAMSMFTGLAGVVQAALITDNFNRDNTGPVTSATSPNPIGTQYQVVSGTWEIGGNSYLQASAGGIMIDTSVALTNDLTLSLSALHPAYADGASGRQAGIILNYQDINNYYGIRWGYETGGDLGSIQFFKMVNNTSSQIGDRVINLNLPSGVFYDWTFSTSENEISYSVSALGSETPLYSGSFTDPDSTFSGGYLGFYRTGSGTVRFDDYSLNVIPEPQALLLLGSGALTLLALRRRIR